MGSKKRVLNAKRAKIETRQKQQQATKNDVSQFELKINKVKHNILGRKIAKNEIGKPILNRSRGLKKRETTLLKEYKNKNKVSGFKDLRDHNLGNVLASKYNEIDLNENEEIELTHKGKPLDEFINDRLESDDEDIDIFGRDDFVETAHFGGGRDGAPRSTKEILEDIRGEKVIKRQEREEIVAITEKLDKQWEDIRSLVRFQSFNKSSHSIDASAREDYDALYTQLTFDSEKPSPQKTKKMIKSETSDESISSNNPDHIFKAKLKLMDSTDDLETIVRNLKEIINSQITVITNKSYELLKEKLVKLSSGNLLFTPQEISILLISTYFKELQVLTHLIIIKALNKLKYSNYSQVATSIFFLNILLKTNTKRFYPEIFVQLRNLINLCMPSGPIELRVFNRLHLKAEVILNITEFSNYRELVFDKQFNVSFSNLFGGIFSDFEGQDNQSMIAYNLALQVAQLAINIFDTFSASQLFIN